MTENNGISEYWRLCEEFTLKQAALLIVGFEPASETGGLCESWQIHERPPGYEAAKQGLIAGLQKGTITGKHRGLQDTDINGNQIGELQGTTDVDATTVERDSLIAWLGNRGIKTGFFFPEGPEMPDYLNEKDPRYAPKLAAATRAWQAVTDTNGKHPKQAMMKWLREHASEYGLTNDDGIPNETGIEQVASVANWQPGGGAPKTPAA